MSEKPPKPPPAPALLTAAQVAERLGVNVRAVRRMAADGRIPPPVRLGAAMRWRVADIEAHLAARKAGDPE